LINCKIQYSHTGFNGVHNVVPGTVIPPLSVPFAIFPYLSAKEGGSSLPSPTDNQSLNRCLFFLVHQNLYKKFLNVRFDDYE